MGHPRMSGGGIGSGSGGGVGSGKGSRWRVSAGLIVVVAARFRGDRGNRLREGERERTPSSGFTQVAAGSCGWRRRLALPVVAAGWATRVKPIPTFPHLPL